MQLSAGGASDKGPRPENQDCYLIDLELGLVLVADGMGGHNAGEVASQMALEAVHDFLRATHGGGDITWPFPFDPSRSRAENRLEVAFRIANQRVHDAGERSSGRAGMGTTIVAALVDNDRIVVGHVGDSRAYLWRRADLRQITRDHTWLNATEAGGDDLRNHPLRHVLTNGIGMGTDLDPTVTELPLDSGDRWFLCSDGVHGYLDPQSLASVLSIPDPEAAARGAVEAALRSGTTDNSTAVVLNVR